MSTFSAAYPALVTFAQVRGSAGTQSLTGNAHRLNRLHSFFTNRNRPDLARAVVAAGELTPELHAEFIVLSRADERRAGRWSSPSHF